MTPHEQHFRSVFELHARRVLAYTSRHTDPASADDVVADVFLVAWRRIEELPPDPLPWLLVVARHTLANAARSGTRRRLLADQLALLSAAAPTPPADTDTALDRYAVLTALASLEQHEREAVLLVAWDELSVSGAAQVAGCSRRVFEARLARARTHLRRTLDRPTQPPGLAPVPGPPTPFTPTHFTTNQEIHR